MLFRSLKRRIDNLRNDINEENIIDNKKVDLYKNKFTETINDDMNIPNAFSVLSMVIKDRELNSREKVYLIEDFDRVLSLDLLINDTKSNVEIDEEYIDKLITERNEARKNKDWSSADSIRDKLKEMNIELVDSKEGTTWEII